MNRNAAIFWLVRRDPALKFGLILAVLGLFWLPLGNHQIIYDVWLAIPVFLAVAAFLAAGSLAILWKSLPWANSALPVKFGYLFTATVLLTWAAFFAPSQTGRRVAGLAAGFAAVVTIPLFSWGWAFVATLAVLCQLWILAPLDKLRTTHAKSASPGWILPLLRSVFSWRQVFSLPVAGLLGWQLGWSWIFLLTDDSDRCTLLQLPISRRVVLGASLLPTLVALLVGIAIGYRADRLDWNIQAPGDTVPPVALDYYLAFPPAGVPVIRSPWGEVALPPIRQVPVVLGTSGDRAYNPFWAGPENSPQFADWQFRRETREIYGKELSKTELAAAVRTGLQPLAKRPRMQFLAMLFGAAVLLVMATLNAAGKSYKLLRITPAFRALGWIPWSLIALELLVPHKTASLDALGGVVQALLLGLSPLLPANNLLMIALLLAALAPLYWVLETIFHEIEFKDKKAEETGYFGPQTATERLKW